MSGMICALAFVPAGACKRSPIKYEVSAEEAEMLKEVADAEESELAEAAAAFGSGTLGSAAAASEETEDNNGGGDDDDNELEGYDKNNRDEHGLPAALRMDEYDDEDEDEYEDDEEGALGRSAALATSLMSNTAGIVGEDDAMDSETHLKGRGGGVESLDEDEDDEGSDGEDNIVERTDMVLLSARTDEDSSILEMHCYDAASGNLWVHHDITLSAFPLSMAFMDIPPSVAKASEGAVGAFVAVGTFKPAIEIWNLDVLDPLEPTAVLGGEASTLSLKDKKKNKKKNKKGKKVGGDPMNADSHTDAVMGLSWNYLQRQVLASASADTTVKLWDVTVQQCSQMLTHHSDKVQAVAWNPAQAPVLATGSYDRTLCVVDARQSGAVSRMAMSADVESICWDPHSPERVVGSCEDGTVLCYDPRAPQQPLWSIQAHGGSARANASSCACSSVAFAPFVRGLFATSGTDGKVKLWDAEAAGAGPQQPVCIGERALGVGELFAMQWNADPATPFTVAAAGSKSTVAIWETDEKLEVAQRFSGRVKPEAQAAVAAETQRQQSMIQGGGAKPGKAALRKATGYRRAAEMEDVEDNRDMEEVLAAMASGPASVLASPSVYVADAPEGDMSDSDDNGGFAGGGGGGGGGDSQVRGGKTAGMPKKKKRQEKKRPELKNSTGAFSGRVFRGEGQQKLLEPS